MKLNMKAERARKGMTCEQVATAIGVHVNAISRWENGVAEPNGRHLVQLAQLYGVTPEYLLGIVDEPSATAVPEMSERG